MSHSKITTKTICDHNHYIYEKSRFTADSQKTHFWKYEAQTCGTEYQYPIQTGSANQWSDSRFESLAVRINSLMNKWISKEWRKISLKNPYQTNWLKAANYKVVKRSKPQKEYVDSFHHLKLRISLKTIKIILKLNIALKTQFCKKTTHLQKLDDIAS